MGLGALPFLLPLMLQVGFGLTALNSGMLTFASAAGAMLMKTSAVRVLRTLGFRVVLVGDAVISAAFLFGYSLFRPSTPHLVIFLALLAGGFFRSLQMTSINTLSYADVPPAMLSRATSLTSMAQQLSQSMGVGTGALLLYLMLGLHHTAVSGPGDFSFALAAVAMLLDLQWRLTIVGELGRDANATGRLHADIARFDLADRVLVTGAIPADRLEALYASSDIFVLASRFEGYGMAFTEAIAHGLPVIGSTAGAIPETVPEGAGLLTPPDDIHALSLAVRRLIEDSAERRRLAAAARAAAAALPTWEQAAELFSRAIESAA